MTTIRYSTAMKATKEQTQEMTDNKLVAELNEKKRFYCNNPLYEIIENGNVNVKPYFDYEEYFDDRATEEYKDKKIREIKKFARLVFGDDAEFAISESIYNEKMTHNNEQKYKLSLHFVIYNVTIQYDALINLTKLLKDVFVNIGIDTEPYKSYQKFRIIGTSKKDMNSPLSVVKCSKLARHFITNPTNEDNYTISSE